MRSLDIVNFPAHRPLITPNETKNESHFPDVRRKHFLKSSQLSSMDQDQMATLSTNGQPQVTNLRPSCNIPASECDCSQAGYGSSSAQRQGMSSTSQSQMSPREFDAVMPQQYQVRYEQQPRDQQQQYQQPHQQQQYRDEQYQQPRASVIHQHNYYGNDSQNNANESGRRRFLGGGGGRGLLGGGGLGGRISARRERRRNGGGLLGTLLGAVQGHGNGPTIVPAEDGPRSQTQASMQSGGRRQQWESSQYGGPISRAGREEADNAGYRDEYR